MYKNRLYDLDLPSEFPQHSELNGGLFAHIRIANIHLPLRYKRQSVCQSNISKLSS